MEKFNPITEGNIPITLFKFAIPLMFAMLLQALYGAADLFVIGLYSGKESISAIANGAQFMHVVMGLIMGMTVGGTVRIGFCVGEKNHEGTALAVGSMAVLFFLISLVLTPILVCLTPAIVSLIRVPPEAIQETSRYILICALGIPFIVGYNVVGAIYRGLGDSKTPVYFVAIACALNVVLDFWFVGGLKLNAAGAAVATVLSQGISFFSALVFMRRKGFDFQMTRSCFRLDPSSVFRILSVGVPLAFQDSLISVSFTMIMAIVNSMGLTESASVGVAGRLIGFFMIPPCCFAGAVAAITSQNLGAGRPERANRSLCVGIAFSLCFSSVVWFLCQIFPEAAPRLFAKDPSVLHGAGLYLQSFSLDCLLVCFIFNLSAYFSGCGKSVVPMIYNLLSTFGVRVPLAWKISLIPGATLFHLGFAAPAATLISIVLAVFFWFRIQKSLKLEKFSKNQPITQNFP